MDNIVRVKVELEDGTEVTPFYSLEIHQEVAAHHRFELRCPMRTFEEDSEPLINRTKDLFGKLLKVGFSTGTTGSSTDYFFKGIITEISVDKYQGIGGDLLIKGFSPTILLEEGRLYATYVDKTISQCIRQVMNDVPSNFLDATIDVAADTNVGYRVQYRESSFHYLKQLAKTYSQWLYFDGRSLYFGKPTEPDPIALTFGIDVGNLKFDLQMVPSHFEYLNYNSNTDDLLTSDSASAQDENLDDLSNHMLQKSEETFSKKMREVAAYRAPDQQGLDTLVATVKKRLSGQYLKVSGSCNNPHLKIGSLIEIAGPNRQTPTQSDSYGRFRIVKLHQRANGGGSYSCEFEALSAQVSAPPNSITNTYENCEDQYATVKDIKDPMKMARVRVQFVWQSGDEASPWLDIAQVMAGDKRGFYFVPDEGDKVIVGFIHNNPNYPYVKGVIYRKDHKLDDGTSTDENKHHLIHFSEKMLLHHGKDISVDGSSTEILGLSNLEGTGHQNYLMVTKDGETGVKIRSKNHTIYINGHKVKVKSDGDVEVEAGGAVKVKATGGNITLDAGTNDVEIKGMNVKIDAQTNFDAKANAQATISGSAMTEIKSSGVVSVQGSLIKLN